MFCVPVCSTEGTDRKMDYENEHDSDVPRLWARDTEDLGAFDTYLFLLFIPVLSSELHHWIRINPRAVTPTPLISKRIVFILFYLQVIGNKISVRFANMIIVCFS